MHGTNPIAKSRIASEGFIVHSIFYTLQGEGPFAGRPAVFLRLSGCNLRCYWCDTEFDSGDHMMPEQLALTLKSVLDRHGCTLIVLTGGEPMLQPLKTLIDSPVLAGFQFQIETAGSYWPIAGLTDYLPNPCLTVVCSPKTGNIVNQLRDYNTYDVYWKYIVKKTEPVDALFGLPSMSTQIKDRPLELFRPTSLYLLKSRIFVQGCDEGDDALTYANVEYAKSIALQFGYRLSLQTHKILGLA